MEYSPIIYFVDPNVAKTRLDWMRIMILKISYLYLSARYYGDEVNLPIQFWKVRFVWLLRTLWSWTLATLILSWTNVLHVNPHSAVFRQTTHGIRQRSMEMDRLSSMERDKTTHGNGHAKRQCFSTNGQWKWSYDEWNWTSTHGIRQWSMEMDTHKLNTEYL